MKKLATIIICLTIFSCGQRGELNYPDLVGKYYNGTDRTNYHDLLLRPDSTYIGHMSYQWGDNMFEYFGQWRINNDTLILFKGKDFSDRLSIAGTRHTKSDILIIDVNELIKTNRQIRFSINDLDLKVNNGKIAVTKGDFMHDKFFDGDYEHTHVNLDIRVKNTFARINYIFADSQLKVSLVDNSKINLITDTVLCKYYKIDSILYSVEELYVIEKNNLKKERG